MKNLGYHYEQSVRKSAHMEWIPFAITLTFFWACNNGDDPAPAIQEGCKLVSEINTTVGPHAPGVTFTNTNSTTNGYDERGNKITQSLSTTINFSDGKSQRRSGSYTYQYDANDFLLRLLVQSSETDITGSTTMQSNDHSYEYSNNRLIKTATVTLQQMVQPQAALYTSTTDKAA